MYIHIQNLNQLFGFFFSVNILFERQAVLSQILHDLKKTSQRKQKGK